MINDFEEKGKLNKIPILKNSSTLHLGPVTVDNRKLTLSSTCAFDSIFQALLVGACDYQEVQHIMETYPAEIFDVVQYVKKHGINHYVHTKRAKILYENDETTKEQVSQDLWHMNCTISVGYVCKQIFEDLPSIVRLSECDYCFKQKREKNPTIMLCDNIFSAKNVIEELEKFVLADMNSKECDKECPGEMVSCIERLGNHQTFLSHLLYS